MPMTSKTIEHCKPRSVRYLCSHLGRFKGGQNPTEERLDVEDPEGGEEKDKGPAMPRLEHSNDSWNFSSHN